MKLPMLRDSGVSYVLGFTWDQPPSSYDKCFSRCVQHSRVATYCNPFGQLCLAETSYFAESDICHCEIKRDKLRASS